MVPPLTIYNQARKTIYFLGVMASSLLVFLLTDVDEVAWHGRQKLIECQAAIAVQVVGSHDLLEWKVSHLLTCQTFANLSCIIKEKDLQS